MKLTKLGIALFLFSIQALVRADINAEFESIKSSPNALYAFLKEMPKGGELHYHLAGGAYPETMLQVAAQGQYCLKPSSHTMTKIREKCEGIPANELAGNQDLYEQTLRAWSMKDFIAGEESGHDHFFASFYKFISLVAENHVPLLSEVIQRAADQHELYMEIMIMPDNARSASLVNLDKLPLDYNLLKQTLLANPAFLAEINKTISFTENLIPEVHKNLKCDQLPEQAACKLTVRFQYYILREQPLKQVFAQALHAFSAASQSKDIVAVNLVQAEDGFISLRDYQQQMAIFGYMHKLYPKVHIALHAGELAPDAVLPANLRFHINEAIHVGQAERIGHGVDIAYENKAENLLKEMAKKSIAVEINLVSNQKILSISGSAHPLNYYLSHQVPVVLSTDDEGILRTDLTRQYLTAVLEHKLDYPTLKQISRNALTYSFLPGKSLWLAKNKPVHFCKDLNSQDCLDFVAKNEKAKLQRALELQLLAFEQQMSH